MCQLWCLLICCHVFCSECSISTSSHQSPDWPHPRHPRLPPHGPASFQSGCSLPTLSPLCCSRMQPLPVGAAFTFTLLKTQRTEERLGLQTGQVVLLRERERGGGMGGKPLIWKWPHYNDKEIMKTALSGKALLKTRASASEFNSFRKIDR